MYYTFRYNADEAYANIGMVQVMASYYLEAGDKGYDKYIKEHPNKTPFRHHTKAFKADVSEDEIRAAFDKASADILDAYLDEDIHRLKNDPPDTQFEMYKKEFESLSEEEQSRLVEIAKSRAEASDAGL